MSTSDSNCKDGASKSNDDGVCEVKDLLQNMSTTDAQCVSVCANCGKEGSSDINNVCNRCKQVKYCNAVCKKVHKKKHKKECDEHVRLAAELHDIELFKQPPPPEDCPICFLRLPTLNTGSTYYSCCGKVICNGCIHAPLYDNQGNKVDNKKCPFCRTPAPYTEEEAIEREVKRVEAGDFIAIGKLGSYYADGLYGFPQDHTKALELFHRSGKLGCSEAYCSIGTAYYNGEGVEIDKKKANHYYELGAIGGDEYARHNLGINEENAGNFDRALRHYMIAVECGGSQSLDAIKRMYSKGRSTKEDYMKALQSYQSYLEEIKSKQRDEAAAARVLYGYY